MKKTDCEYYDAEDKADEELKVCWCTKLMKTSKTGFDCTNCPYYKKVGE